jgi:hypothetical protein
MINKITLKEYALFIIVIFLNSNHSFAQKDTTIILDKKSVKEFLEFQKYAADSKHDLVPDFSEEWIITDRPHVAETPHLVPKGYFQWETGFQFQQSRTDLIKTKDITYNTTLIRLGLSRRIEARLEMDYFGTKSNRRSDDSLLQKVNGLSGLTVASKVFLFQQNGLIPETSLLYGISLPYPGSKDFRPSYTGSEIKFLLVNRIAKWYEFEYNLGVQWDGVTNAYAFNNEFEINRRLFFFIEMYGYFYENGDKDDRFSGSFTNDHRLNGGIWYRLAPNLQLDLSGGFGLSKISPTNYIAVGLSNRFKFKKK